MPLQPLHWSAWLSAQHSGDQLAHKGPLATRPRASFDGESVFVEPGKAFQEILGFGGAMTEAVALNLASMPERRREEVLAHYFRADAGHGYTFCRVAMNSCDFALGNYACAEQDGDHTLASFQIDRDRKLILPYLRRAIELSEGKLRVLASPWSPPAWMKTNGTMNGGGKLRPECRAAWALHYVKFVQAYAAAGVPIWGLTIQNEPDASQRWDSCLYSAEEERDFVRDHLGPALGHAGLDHIKLILWDHNRDQLVHRAAVAYADPNANRLLWGSGFHWYVQDKFDNVRLHHDAWPDKHLIFTEGCQEGGTHLGSWAVGERYARSIIADLNRWTEAWIDWNLVLDISGGPNHVDNLCSAPVLSDAASGRVHYHSSWHAIGHFSRFLTPGSRRVLCATTRDDLEAVAGLRPDGKLAVIVLNATDHARSVRIHTLDTETLLELPAHSVCTALGQSQGADWVK